MLKTIAFALFLFIVPTACSMDETSSTDRAIISQDCAQDTDCPSGFECEVEVEHGVTTSYCQAHDSGGQCPAGFELEIEHGQAFCKPHGGDNGGTGTGTSGASCATDADCAAGLECELEHGAGLCKPHGG